jgi:hypothetical protein
MAGIAGTYRVTAVKYKASSSSAEQDYYNFVFSDPCERDDTHTFNANGTYIFTDAGTKCVPPGDFTSNWTLSGNTMTVDGDPGNIESFNCSTLVVSSTDAIIVGDKITVTFTRQ